MNLDTQLTQILSSLENNFENSAFDNYFRVLSQIEQENTAHSALVSILKMMRALGSYLKSNKENVHPDTLKTLILISENAQRLNNFKDLDKNQIHKIFQESHRSFKSIKQKIASHPAFSDIDMDELRSVFLAIDWEITDTTLNSFEQVVTRFLSRIKPNSIFHSYLKMMQSIGRYIGTKKANIHTDSISLLRTIFSNFERIVQSPEMDQHTKKQIIGTDIKRFEIFKQKISDKSSQITRLISQEDSMRPALSHVKSSMAHHAGQSFELTELPEVQENALPASAAQIEDIPPALAGKGSSNTPAIDVMDDLFNAKETPADELLDAIHLMDVHGNEDHALKMLDRKEELQAQGIQNFTPKRLDTDPIPEIGNRLDQFFSLKEPDSSPDNSNDEISFSYEDPEPSLVSKIPSADPGLVPFEDEDESFDSTQEAEHTNVITDDGGQHNTQSDDLNLKTLQSFLLKPGWEKDRWSLQSIQKECYNLKDLRPNNIQTNKLLEIILLLSQNLEEHANQDLLEEPSLSPQKGSKGFFGKIKGIFTS
ncbi:MAG: hypothetical protein ABIJ59_07055 [Pseudomonadota bacterium]